MYGNEHATPALTVNTPALIVKMTERNWAVIPNRIGLDDMGREKMSQSNAVQQRNRPLERRSSKANFRGKPSLPFDSRLDLA